MCCVFLFKPITKEIPAQWQCLRSAPTCTTQPSPTNAIEPHKIRWVYGSADSAARTLPCAHRRRPATSRLVWRDATHRCRMVWPAWTWAVAPWRRPCRWGWCLMAAVAAVGTPFADVLGRPSRVGSATRCDQRWPTRERFAFGRAIAWERADDVRVLWARRTMGERNEVAPIRNLWKTHKRVSGSSILI